MFVPGMYIYIWMDGWMDGCIYMRLCTTQIIFVKKKPRSLALVGRVLKNNGGCTTNPPIAIILTKGSWTVFLRNIGGSYFVCKARSSGVVTIRRAGGREGREGREGGRSCFCFFFSWCLLRYTGTRYRG